MMRKFINTLIFLVLFLSQYIFSQTDADKIIKKMDENLSFPNAYMKLKMINIKNSKEDRVFLMEVKYKKDKGTIIEFTQPAREKGKKILSRGDSLWMFVPGVSRPVRLSLKESFMGSAMSNYDLTDYEYDNDFFSKIISEEKFKEKDVYVIELTGKKKTTYDKIIVYVDKKFILPVYMEFYTLSGHKIKEMDFDDVKNIGGKLRPQVMTMRDVLDKTFATQVILLDLKKQDFSDDIFSPQKLGE